MPKRSSTKKDENQMARSIVDAATNDTPTPTTPDGKNAAAVALGRLGGLKGGKARASSLSRERRIAIARKAAKARWK